MALGFLCARGRINQLVIFWCKSRAVGAQWERGGRQLSPVTHISRLAGLAGRLLRRQAWAVWLLGASWLLLSCRQTKWAGCRGLA